MSKENEYRARIDYAVEALYSDAIQGTPIHPARLGAITAARDVNALDLSTAFGLRMLSRGEYTINPHDGRVKPITMRDAIGKVRDPGIPSAEDRLADVCAAHIVVEAIRSEPRGSVEDMFFRAHDFAARYDIEHEAIINSRSYLGALAGMYQGETTPPEDGRRAGYLARFNPHSDRFIFHTLEAACDIIHELDHRTALDRIERDPDIAALIVHRESAIRALARDDDRIIDEVFKPFEDDRHLRYQVIHRDGERCLRENPRHEYHDAYANGVLQQN